MIIAGTRFLAMLVLIVLVLVDVAFFVGGHTGPKAFAVAGEAMF